MVSFTYRLLNRLCKQVTATKCELCTNRHVPEGRATYNSHTSPLLKHAWESVPAAVPAGAWRLSRSPPRRREKRALLAEETAQAKTWPCQGTSCVWERSGWWSTGGEQRGPPGEGGRGRRRASHSILCLTVWPPSFLARLQAGQGSGLACCFLGIRQEALQGAQQMKTVSALCKAVKLQHVLPGLTPVEKAAVLARTNVRWVITQPAREKLPLHLRLALNPLSR